MTLVATKAQPANTDSSQAADRHADLRNLGFTGLKAVHANLPPAALYEHALRNNEAELTADGALSARTGSHTGRSPNDRFIVRDSQTDKTVDWGKVNIAISPEAFDALHQRMIIWAQGRTLYTQNLLAGADKVYRLPIRMVTQYAWHSLFVRNMFIRPTAAELATHDPEFTVIDFPEFQADPARDGTRSETFILVNFSKKLVLIGGTAYAGEMKKSIFGIMNYLLPERGVMPMHASANIGAEGDVAIFFGLSGTGKTTLSADASRTLIGDDEHGWTDHTVFNFEGGCYAKAIRLNPVQEPEIYGASRRFGTVLENVVMDDRRRVDFDSAKYAENSRSCYPVDFISNASETGIGGLPRHIIMLTCDAFGVLPPLSKLSPEQAMYHFLSGYTARVAGTERGVTEPTAAFSACFGAPFMPRAPGVYAKLLGEKIDYHKVNCWLVNTGWTGGGHGQGERMPINITRALIRAIFNGTLEQTKFVSDGTFGLNIPANVPGIPAEVLTPRAAWKDKAAYDKQASHVAKLFAENFKKFEAQVDDKVRAAAMQGAQ
jgi:phosphoenolpyruvate carboxykinase (ATP)